MFQRDDEQLISFVILAVALILISGVIASRVFGVTRAERYTIIGTGILVTGVGIAILLVTQYRILRQKRGR